MSAELLSSINWILNAWHNRFYQESLYNSLRIPSKTYMDENHFMLPCHCGATGSHVYTHLTLVSDGSNCIAKKYIMCSKCGLMSEIIDIKDDSFKAWRHAVMLASVVQLIAQNRKEV